MDGTCWIAILRPEATFRRADANADGGVTISDGVRILNALFLGSAALDCLDAADANDDSAVNLSDPLAIFGFLFLGGAVPPSPGPSSCGPDPTADGLTCVTPPACP